MKFKSKINILMRIIPILVALVCFSCKEEVTVREPGTIQAIGGGGTFYVTNVTTGVTIELPYENKIKSSPGDIISVEFIPKEEYNEYHFNTIFEFPDKTIENTYIAEYEVGIDLTGSYKINLYASSEGKNDEMIWNISASGLFTLEIEEKESNE